MDRLIYYYGYCTVYSIAMRTQRRYIKIVNELVTVRGYFFYVFQNLKTNFFTFLKCHVKIR